MSAVPLPVAGALTVALIVLLGIFVYPALLARPAGRWAVGAATVGLALLFHAFEGPYADSTFGRTAVALLLALAPLGAALLVARLRGKSGD